MLRIVIPTFNRSEKLIYLLLNMKPVITKNKMTEVVVVDDGSNASNKEALKKYSKHEDFVKFIFLENNKGGGYARNCGAFMGGDDPEWVWFFDDDDSFDPQAIIDIQRKLILVRNNDLVLLSARYHQHGKIKILVPIGENIYSMFARKGHQVNTSCAIFRYKLLKGINGWDANLVAGQDTDIFLRAAEFTDAEVMEDIFVDVKDHDEDRVTRNPTKQIKGKVQFLLKNYSRLHPLRSLRYFVTIIILLPFIRKTFRYYFRKN